MGFRALLLFSISILHILLAGLVLLRARKGGQRIAFASLAVSTALWTATNAFFAVDGLRGDELQLPANLSYVAAVGIFSSLASFSYLFPRERISKFNPNHAALLVTFIATGLYLVFPYGGAAHISESNVITPGYLVLPSFGFILLSFVLIVRNFLANRKSLRGIERYQLRLVSIGCIAPAIVGMVFNLILPIIDVYSFTWVGPAASLIFTSCITYAIIAQRLFDIRIVIRTTVIFGGLLLFVGSIYGFLTVFLLNQLHLGDNPLVTYAVNVATLLVVGFTFEPIRDRLAEWTDRWLYQKEATQQSLLSELTRQLNESTSLDTGLDGILSTALKALRLHHAVAYAYEPTGTRGFQVKRLRQVGYSVGDGKLMLDPNDVVIRYFTTHANTALMRDLEVSLGWEEALLKRGGENATTELVREHAAKSSVTKRVHLLDAVAAVPLHHGEEPLGLILLGPKLSGDGYTSDDVAFLELLAGQAVLAIQKARLIEGDQQKTEFVSIASHELLTPITAIEGYLSMVLDEGLGQVDDKARGYLEKVYSSAQRLSTLIKDLLNISRLESGRLKVEVQPTDLAKMLEEGVDQYQVLAEEKGLGLTLKLPKTLPLANIDQLRTSEVINNLVGNAIKYTLHGSVTVSAKVSGKDLVVTVKDTGLGMSKQEMGRLFEKFYRVDNPNRAQIQGTGLGLYITKQIVERMGGTITVDSKPGIGSTFSVTLPKA